MWTGAFLPKPEGLLVTYDSALFSGPRFGDVGRGGAGLGRGGRSGFGQPRIDAFGPMSGGEGCGEGGPFRVPVPMHPGGLDGVGFCDGARFGQPNPGIAKPPAF